MSAFPVDFRGGWLAWYETVYRLGPQASLQAL
jgi:hypothetical protein